MKWHPSDIPGLMTHLPEAVRDLMHHEDTELVQAAVDALKRDAAGEGERHHIAELLNAPVIAAPANPSQAGAETLSIEKSLDPLSQRSAENMGLLLHDYLYHLPTFRPSGSEGEKLLEHWRQILLEQPERMAVARQSYWNSPEAKEFWKHRLSQYRTDFGITHDMFPDFWEDWQRAAGAEHALMHPAEKGVSKERQWQDWSSARVCIPLPRRVKWSGDYFHHDCEGN